jgi:hypothetical protein
LSAAFCIDKKVSFQLSAVLRLNAKAISVVGGFAFERENHFGCRELFVLIRKSHFGYGQFCVRNARLVSVADGLLYGYEKQELCF